MKDANVRKPEFIKVFPHRPEEAKSDGIEAHRGQQVCIFNTRNYTLRTIPGTHLINLGVVVGVIFISILST